MKQKFKAGEDPISYSRFSLNASLYLPGVVKNLKVTSASDKSGCYPVEL